MKITLMWIASIFLAITFVFLLLTKGVYCAKEGEILPGGMIVNGCCKNMETIAPVGGNNSKQYAIGNKCYREEVGIGRVEPYRPLRSYKEYFLARIKNNKQPLIQDIYSSSKGQSICSNCGDNVCNTYENICNCPQDCKNEQNSEYESFDTFCKKISVDVIKKCSSYFSSDFKKSNFSSLEILPIECLCQKDKVKEYNFVETCSKTTDNLCWYTIGAR